ncbi:hypothetical protein like AT3G02555 [Hibiscus trionum]|uniref:Uncharacterized protein n=1 Tax=Hibiscus trionum TaxID=183268 RepID=A0A9W7ILF9_HIBTR|nr:hypothetical protein like AT3G02555 [Hibiscus trionum]GMI97222.1 hypothetical protein like AT3G02555 [Hibiscus trionum]
MSADAELLDIIMKKRDFEIGQSADEVASSPPFFCGSPPSRVSNPLVHDAHFGDETLTALQILSPSSPCTRMKFGYKPATVRVEGFDCLNRDHI